MVRQEVYRKLGHAIQADEETLRVQLEVIQAELNAPTQFKVCSDYVVLVSFLIFSMSAGKTISDFVTVL